MPSDIKVTYDDVKTVSTRLNSANADTVPKLTTVQNTVNALLTDGGGLWLREASPVLEAKYQSFNTSVTQALNAIPSWANQFDNIVTQISDMDRQIVQASEAGGDSSKR
ncbi:hypothetical protein [Kineosporia succinea]|uniref:Uncharacterized protein YukE n=1 Tax=Kineosporia succinea TaxID=84632 RepID=A0ABT9PE57_9ACTN|nr:hypothetical protein [Kineosporia succinea]MDP9830992.1 uncharacterized protein YukE [Kineosporia succinea]